MIRLNTQTHGPLCLFSCDLPPICQPKTLIFLPITQQRLKQRRETWCPGEHNIQRGVPKVLGSIANQSTIEAEQFVDVDNEKSFFLER